MDLTKFGACTSSGKYKTSLQASAREGTKLGITGTPTFFVNGRILVGYQPLGELSASSTRSSRPRRRVSPASGAEAIPGANLTIHIGLYSSAHGTNDAQNV
jgi:hypothetical protein